MDTQDPTSISLCKLVLGSGKRCPHNECGYESRLIPIPNGISTDFIWNWNQNAKGNFDVESAI